MKPQTVQIVRQGKATQRRTGLNLIHYKNNKAYGYNCMPYLLFQSNFNCNIY